MIAMQQGTVEKSFDTFAIDDVAGTPFALLAQAQLATWQTSFGTAPVAINIIIETSLDNSSWSTVATTTDVNGETGSFTTSALFIRASIVSHNAGDTVTVQLVSKVAFLASSVGAVADTEVLFSDNGIIAGDSGLTWDKTNKILTLAESSLAGIIVGEVNAISTQDGTSVVLGVNELDGNQPVLMLAGTEDTGGGQVVFHRSFGTVAAPTTVTPGNNVGGILFNGYNSVAGGFQMNANIFAYVPSNGLPHGLLQFTVSPGSTNQIWSMTDSGGFILPNGGALQTDTTTAHTALLQAYDVDGAAYKTFLTLLNGNTPDMTIAPPSGGTVNLKGTLATTENATTGLVAGVLAATTNASIVIKDGTGQVYRIPCII